MNIINNIIRHAVKHQEKLNFLVLAFDGKFEEMLATIGHNIYIYPALAKFPWNPKLFNTFNVLKSEKIPIDLPIDAVICNDRVSQYDLAYKLSYALHVPLILIDHFHPAGLIHMNDIDTAIKTQKADINMTTDKNITESWRLTTAQTINYNVQINSFIEKKEQLILTDGTFTNMDYTNIYGALNNFRFIINNQLDHKFNKENVDRFYKMSDIYVHLSPLNYIPISLLNAMAYGCAVITINNELLKDIIQHGHNGFLINNLAELKNYITTLRQNIEMKKNIAHNAKQTIMEKYNTTEQWQQILNNTANITFKR